MSEPALQVLPGRAEGDRRVPPFSLEAEQTVIAVCLLDGGETLTRALQAGVSAKAFYSTAHVKIWETLVEMFRGGAPVAIEALTAELQTRKLLPELGGVAYISEIIGRAPTTLQAKFFFAKVLELSALRAAIRIGNEIVESAYLYEGGPVDEFFAEPLSKLSAAVRHARRGAHQQDLSASIAAVEAETVAAQQGKLDKSGWIYTGLPEFDKRCLPLGSNSEDNLVIDAAGSGLGKSALMRQVAAHALGLGRRVRIYTRETSIAGCIEQMAATRAEADLKYREEWPQDVLERFLGECSDLRALADKRLWCVENSSATPLHTIEELEDDARYFAALQGPPQLWVVDYLQLFGAKRRFHSREQEVAYVSHKLQALTRELGGVWLVGCQLNERGLAEMRRTNRDEDGKLIHRIPNAGDLRESQAIYHDADRVIAHYLPPEDSRGEDQTGPNIGKPEVWLCQIKRRKGGTGVVKCWFEKKLTRFVEIPRFFNAAAPGAGMTKSQFKGEQK